MYKLIIYLCFDCCYLLEEYFVGCYVVMNVISVYVLDLLLQLVVDLDICNCCWDDKKVDVYYVIILIVWSFVINLMENEVKVYNLIVCQYLM